MRPKIIKRYQNRKLYDTQQSCYVTLDDIAKMIRKNEDVKVIDNKTKNNITGATLTQIIFETEKRAAQFPPLFVLRDIIQNGNGSISSYLAKLGAFPEDYAAKQATQEAAQQKEMDHVAMTASKESEKPSFDNIKQTLEERVANAASASTNLPNLESNNPSFGMSSEEEPPSLPNSNKTLGI